jgi:hypothetical protein
MVVNFLALLNLLIDGDHFSIAVNLFFFYVLWNLLLLKVGIKSDYAREKCVFETSEK